MTPNHAQRTPTSRSGCHFGFPGEILGGIILGIGLGIFITKAFLASSSHQIAVPPLLWAAAFICVSGGSLIARSARLKRLSKHDIDDKPDANSCA